MLRPVRKLLTWIARNLGDENISSMACWTWTIVTLDLGAPLLLEAADLYFNLNTSNWGKLIKRFKNYISASSAARREMSNARRASPEAADTLRAINSTASGSKDTKFSNL